MAEDKDFIVMGRVTGLYGVRGWVRVYSHTVPREEILDYSPWYLRLNGQWVSLALLSGKRHGKGVVAHLVSCEDRDTAARLMGADIAVRREQLPPLEAGEYYWDDLIGLRVVTVTGVELGEVDHLLETGANDVLVVKGERERLIPFLPDSVVVEVDLEGGTLRVDWDPDF